MRLLIVHPDPQVQQSLGEGLQAQWSETHILLAGTVEDALGLLHTLPADVVLLSTGLPNRFELELLRAIRRVSDAPVLLLATSSVEADQIEALRLGADDYIVEPASAALLGARIDAVRRRGLLTRPPDGQPDHRVGALSVWLRRQEVMLNDETLKLTPLEHKLLHALVRNAGVFVPSQVLLDLVWGPDYGATTKYLKVFVNRLRSKLERAGGPRYIQSARGLGYRLVPTMGDAVAPGPESSGRPANGSVAKRSSSVPH